MKRITLKGKEYPFCLRMGTMRRYHSITGESISKLKDDDECKAITLAYCAVATGCALESVEFNMSEDEFADLLDPIAFAELSNGLANDNSSSSSVSKKKVK